MPKKSLLERIRKLEYDYEKQREYLLVQEHRIIPILKNLIKFLKEKDSVGFKSSLKSLLVYIFSGRLIVMTCLGIPSLITIWLMIDSNMLLKEQNQLVLDQNNNLIKQINIDTKFEIERNLYNPELNDIKRSNTILEYGKFLRDIDQEPNVIGIDIPSGVYDSLNFKECKFFKENEYKITNSVIYNPIFDYYNVSLDKVFNKGIVRKNTIDNCTIYNYHHASFIDFNDKLNKSKRYGLPEYVTITNSNLIYDKKLDKEYFQYSYPNHRERIWIPRVDKSQILIKKEIGHSFIKDSKVFLEVGSFYGTKGDSSNRMLMNDTILVNGKNVAGKSLHIGNSIYSNVCFKVNNIHDLHMEEILNMGTTKFVLEEGVKNNQLRVFIHEDLFNINEYEGENIVQFSSLNDLVINIKFESKHKDLIKKISDKKILLGKREYKCTGNAIFNIVSSPHFIKIY